MVDVSSMVTKKLFTITIVVEERKTKKEHVIVAIAESSHYPEKVHEAYNVPSKVRGENGWANVPSSDILAKYAVQKVVAEILDLIEKYKNKLKEPEKVTFT